MCEDWMAECPVCSVFLNIAVVLSFLLICWCAADDTVYNGILPPQKLVALPVVLFFLLYACYMIECYHASSRKLLSKVLRGETIFQVIERLQATSPEIHFKAVCWHNEQRSRMVPVIDRRGKTRMQNETYREKVVTLTDTEKFNFQKFKDITELPAEMDKYSLAVISFTKSFQFTDPASKSLFINLSCGFQARNRHRDKHVDFEEPMTLEGFSDHVIAYVDLDQKEPWINIWFYWLFSALLMSWLFRWMFKRRIFTKEIKIVKELQVII